MPQQRRLRVLCACEMSGRVRDAFAARGWEAWSADLLASENPAALTYYPDGGPTREHPGVLPRAPGYHYQGDVRDLFDWRHPVNAAREAEAENQFILDGVWPYSLPLWDLVLAFPPCDHLALAGARYWKQKREDGRQDAAAEFFIEMINAPAPHVATENPAGDMKRRYRPPDQVVEPFMFGDPLRKKTCLWLKGLPLLVPDCPVEPEGRVATGGGSHRTDIRAGRGKQNGHEDGEGRAMRRVVRSRTLPGLARVMALQWGAYVEQEEN